MCGIIGFVADKGLSEGLASQMILNGYLAQQERGSQSFGALVQSAIDRKIVKSLQLSTFVKNFAKLDNKTNLVLFHHRMASVGTISKANTHPFVAGNICLVHNGTWVGSSLFKSNFVTELKGDTDSEVIAHMINVYGIQNTAKEISGSASLVWIDKLEGTLNFWRVSTPMHICYVPSKDILFFASTMKAVDAMISVLKIKKIAGLFQPYYEITTNEEYLYTIKLNEGLFLPKDFKIIKSKQKYESSKRYYYNQWDNYFNNNKTNKDAINTNKPDLFDYPSKLSKTVDYNDYDDSYDCSLPKGYQWDTRKKKSKPIEPTVYTGQAE